MSGLHIDFDTLDTAIPVDIPIGPMYTALRQAAIVSSDESRGIDFTFKIRMAQLVKLQQQMVWMFWMNQLPLFGWIWIMTEIKI